MPALQISLYMEFAPLSIIVVLAGAGMRQAVLVHELSLWTHDILHIGTDEVSIFKARSSLLDPLREACHRAFDLADSTFATSEWQPPLPLV
jgi:hypothetical protein